MNVLASKSHDGVAVDLRDITHFYVNRGRCLPVVDRVGIQIHENQVAAIVGPSGCGKTTILRMIAGLLTPSCGNVWIHGQSPAVYLDLRKVSFMFQKPVLLPWRTVRENVLLPFELGPKRRGGADACRPAAADHWINVVGLDDFQDYYPHRLSGGMQSRAALARALATAPSLLLMDEPFGHLDELSRLRLNQELAAMHIESLPTIVLVTHSIEEAVLLADRVFVLSSCPARVSDVIDINIARPRPRHIVDSPAFQQYVKQTRSSLNEGCAS